MWFICNERPFRDGKERGKWWRRRWKNQLAIVSILANHRSHNQSIILRKQTAQHSIDVYKLFDKIILNDFISAIYFGIFPCERTVPIFCLGSFLLLLLFLLCKHNIFHFSYRVDVCKIMHWTLAVFDSGTYISIDSCFILCLVAFIFECNAVVSLSSPIKIH